MKAAVIGPQPYFPEFVAVQIHERGLPFPEMRLETWRTHDQFGVALMSRTFADRDACGAETKEAARGRSDERGVRVYRLRKIFHQIWFEENCLAKHLQMEEPQSVHEKSLNLLGVFDCIQDRYK